MCLIVVSQFWGQSRYHAICVHLRSISFFPLCAALPSLPTTRYSANPKPRWRTTFWDADRTDADRTAQQGSQIFSVAEALAPVIDVEILTA